MSARFMQVGKILLVFLMGTASGCLHCFHPTPEPPREQIEATKQFPTPARDRVYVFLLNGIDPMEVANLSGVREYLNDLGFGKVYYGQLYHAHWYLGEMRRIRSECPESRFVVVGYEYGAESAKSLVEKAAGEGTEIDELIYLEPKGIGSLATDASPHCRKTLTIQATRWFNDPVAPTGTESVVLPNTSKLGLPTNPVVLEILAAHLQEIAGTIPIVSPAYPEPEVLFGQTLTPRTVSAKATSADEWDFLKPNRGQVVVSTNRKASPK